MEKKSIHKQNNIYSEFIYIYIYIYIYKPRVRERKIGTSYSNVIFLHQENFQIYTEFKIKYFESS
jgi:hypothetical protein